MIDHGDRMKEILIIVVMIAMIFMIGYGDIIIRKYTLSNQKVKQDIHVGLISDLHGTFYGKHQEKLIQCILKQEPDILLFAGDIFDEYHDFSAAEELFKGIAHIPCFYVLGNHECHLDQEEAITALMEKYHICMIGQKAKTIKIHDTLLCIAGVDDPYSLNESNELKDQKERMKKTLEFLHPSFSNYSLLLSHRPSFVDIYQKSSFDLVVSGHAHGGQWRIPYVLNGLLAPDEGLFPRYAGGKYKLNEQTYLIVSRGLARNLIPRFFNRPEFVMIHIHP